MTIVPGLGFALLAAACGCSSSQGKAAPIPSPDGEVPPPQADGGALPTKNVGKPDAPPERTGPSADGPARASDGPAAMPDGPPGSGGPGATPDANTGGPCTGSGPLPWPKANSIVCDVRNHAPKIPANTCVVTDPAYGAKGDGTIDDTAAFAKAIAACEAKGGGHVNVPAGTYSTGAITLDNNIDLHFESGAVIKFNGNMNEYPMVQTRYQGTGLTNHSPMIYAFGKHDLSVTGPGVLDASGSPNFSPRVNFVEPYSCNNVVISGITLKGAHFWQVHPTASTYVWIEGVTTTDSGLGNNDGFDPESCVNCVLTNSTIQAGDDAMAIKSGRDDYGRMINIPTANFVFMHTSFSSRWGLMTLGSELSGGIHDVYGYDLKTTGPGVAYAFEIKGNCLRGATVKDVHLDTLVSTGGVHKGVMWADMNYMNQNPAGSCPHVPMYSDFSIGHATVSGSPFVLDITNDPRFPIRNIGFTDSAYSNIGNASNAAAGSNVTWSNVTINGAPAH
jgi:polygalacturonase